MINRQEKLKRESIKGLAKMCVMQNPNLNEWQKQQELDRIDNCFAQADALDEIRKSFMNFR